MWYEHVTLVGEIIVPYNHILNQHYIFVINFYPSCGLLEIYPQTPLPRSLHQSGKGTVRKHTPTEPSQLEQLPEHADFPDLLKLLLLPSSLSQWACSFLLQLALLPKRQHPFIPELLPQHMALLTLLPLQAPLSPSCSGHEPLPQGAPSLSTRSPVSPMLCPMELPILMQSTFHLNETCFLNYSSFLQEPWLSPYTSHLCCCPWQPYFV